MTVHGTQKTILVALGQELRGDDGAGLAAVRLWMEQYSSLADHPGLRVELAGLPGAGLLDLLDGAQSAVLVDAVHSPGPAGRIYSLRLEDLAAFESGFGSAHGWGVAETLALGSQLGGYMLPEDLILVGIGASSIRMGDGLSEPVRQALPAAAARIQELLLERLE